MINFSTRSGPDPTKTCKLEKNYKLFSWNSALLMSCLSAKCRIIRGTSWPYIPLKEYLMNDKSLLNTRLPLTSTRWVPSTTKLCTVRSRSSVLLINLGNIETSGILRIKPRAAGRIAIILSTVLYGPLQASSCWLNWAHRKKRKTAKVDPDGWVARSWGLRGLEWQKLLLIARSGASTFGRTTNARSRFCSHRCKSPFSIRFILLISFLLAPALVKIVVAAIEPRTSWLAGNLADHSTASVQLRLVILEEHF